MFTMKIPDVTAAVRAATHAPEVADARAYPAHPAPNAVVFDRALGHLVIWDGAAWVPIPTAPAAREG
jgi:hypothetical protein